MMKKILREPLLHFLLIGVGLFLLFGLTQGTGNDDAKKIVVKQQTVSELTAKFTRTWMRPPTEEEVAGLIREHVRDEIYYREAVALGLDQDDPMIRRRMRQKLEFILEDLTVEETPGDDVLTAFLKNHEDQYRISPQVSFQHVYLNPEKHEDVTAAAEKILLRLRAGAPPESMGDATMAPQEFRLTVQSDIARWFGEAFALDVAALAPGKWSEPLSSGLGVHLVRVLDRRPGRLPELDEVRSEVQRDYIALRRQQQKDQAYSKLLQYYEVVIEAPQENQASTGKAMATTQSRETGK